MASFRKQAGKWRAEIARRGVRKSQVFATKAEAVNWAAREETAIVDVEAGVFPKRTLAEAIDDYVAKVSVLKAGARMEEMRLASLKRDFPAMCAKILSKITTADIAVWRDERLKHVTKGSVQRELSTISNLFSVARREWKWCGESPTRDLKAPGANPARERLPTQSEVRRLLRGLCYRTDELPTSKTAECGYAYLLALRTGMRAGELLQLSPATVQGNVAVVTHKMQYKTGRPRRVPLSRHAVRLLKGFPGFTVSSASLDALFRKARDRLLIDDLHFHDARASALTRFSAKVDVLELARISGHKDLRILNEVYYRKSSEDIGRRL